MTFPSLADALRAGWQVYDRDNDGYAVRARTAVGWIVGRVDIPPRPTEAKRETAR